MTILDSYPSVREAFRQRNGIIQITKAGNDLVRVSVETAQPGGYETAMGDSIEDALAALDASLSATAPKP